jgi:hypothetical protein
MLSRCTLELNAAVLARRGVKLKCINNIDPYLLLEFQKNTLSDEIEQYRIRRRCIFWKERVLAPTSSGFVYELFVIASVQRSYHENTVNCWVITNLNGMVRSAHCKCEAGLEEVCSHVCAVLYAITETQHKDKVGSIITPY